MTSFLGKRPSKVNLRERLSSPGIIRMPSAIDPLSAMLIERAGFDAVHVTGSGIARSFGFPDIGLVTMTEMIDRTRAIVRAVNCPVIADADTGYGNAINVMRTVAEFESAGASAIHLEDQVTPKKCGHYEGKELITIAEMALKIEAACAARVSPDFLIMARTDARAVEGFDAALRRCEAYLGAGADILYIEAPESIAEVEEIPKRIAAPHLINMYSGGRTPRLQAKVLDQMGYKIVSYPSHIQRAAIRSMIDALESLSLDDPASIDDDDLFISFAEREAIVGFAEFSALQDRYLPAR
jgi:2-methylisocitrate lyase-like PEP mutase family enzyme